MKTLDIKKPLTLEEAYNLYTSTDKSKLLAGGLFIRLQKQTIPLLIDLDKLKLDYIKEISDGFIVGPMTTLRTLELSDLPSSIVESVKQISGVGTRNIATIGGSICGRYPFSDINTALLALNAYLIFYKSGKMSMKDFYQNGLDKKDLLIEIIIPKAEYSATKYYKKVYTDFSLVNVSLANTTIAVGARPMKTCVLNNCDFSKSSEDLLSQVEFGDDFQASGAYRRSLACALLEDILQERGGHYGS